MSSDVRECLVYLLYGGGLSYRHEIKFSIISALRESAGRPLSIVVYTDEPNVFSGWPVEVVELNPETLLAWTGGDGYLHRRKAMAIQDALRRFEQVIFIDTDTFFTASPHALFERLAQADWIVDEVEGTWGAWNDQLLYHATAGWLREQLGVGDNMRLINSGVLGFSKCGEEIMTEAVRLIDDLYPLAPDVHVIEQFAVGCAARNLAAPAQSNGIVCHYFGEKAFWRAMLVEFFAQYGEVYNSALIEASCGFPKKRIKPVWWRRLHLRLLSLGLCKPQRKLLRAAFFSIYLPSGAYAKACSFVYAKDYQRLSGSELERDGVDGVRRFTARQNRKLHDVLKYA